MAAAGGALVPTPNRDLFAGVVYHIHESVPLRAQDALHDVFALGSGQRAEPHPQDHQAIEGFSGRGKLDSFHPAFDLWTTTHVVTDTLDILEYRVLAGSWGGDQSPDGPGSIITVQLPRSTTGGDSEERRIYLVTPLWVTRSFDLQQRASARYYSPDPDRFFSGVVLAVDGLMDGDEELIASTVEARGGQFRTRVTHTCTHLVCARADSETYQHVRGLTNLTNLRVVLPHWFHACVAQGTLVLDAPFLYPDPPILKSQGQSDFEWTFLAQDGTKLRYRDPGTYPESRSIEGDETATTRILGADPLRRLKNDGQKAYLSFAVQDSAKFVDGVDRADSRTAVEGADSMRSEETTVKLLRRDRLSSRPAQPVFAGRRVYLASTLAISSLTRKALEQRIHESGGECTSKMFTTDADDGAPVNVEEALAQGAAGEAALLESDYVVMDFREGWEYWLARDRLLSIGSLQWLLGALTSDRVRAPTDRLLDFPTPRDPAYARSADSLSKSRGEPPKGWTTQEVTVTNYNGPTRNYLIKMIERLGGRYSGGLDVAKTTLLVAANKAGAKAMAAARREIQIVNHSYVEDCFSAWSLLPIEPRHVGFPKGVNHLDAVGETALSATALKRWEELNEVQRNRQAEMQMTPSVVIGARGKATTPAGVQAEETTDDEEMQGDDLTGLQDVSPVKPRREADAATDEEVSMAMVVDVDTTREEGLLIPPIAEGRGGSRPPPTANSRTVDMDIDGQGAEDEDEVPGPSAAMVEDQLIPNRSTPPRPSRKPAPEDDELSSPDLPSTAEAMRTSARPASEPSRQTDVSAGTDELRDVVVRRTSAATSHRLDTSDDITLPDAVDEDMIVVAAKSKPKSKSAAKPPSKGAKPVSKGRAKPASRRASDAPAAETSVAGRASRKAAVAASRNIATAAEDMNVFAKEKKRKRPSLDKDDIVSLSDSGGTTTTDRDRKKVKGKVVAADSDDEEDEEEEGEEPVASGSGEPVRSRAAPVKNANKKLGVAKGPVPAKLKSKRVRDHVEEAKAGRQVIEFDSTAGTAKSEQPASSAVVNAGKQVVILQSGYRLSDKLIKSLERLGARFTEDPKEHTHLCTDRLSRTEKFLLSITKGVYIVRPQWAEQSAKAGTLLDESKFPLADAKAEKARRFSLVKSLDRAKDRPLLKGHTFYLSPKLQPAPATLQRVIEAAGGVAHIRCPLVKDVRSEPRLHHVVSSAEEQRWWAPLTRREEDEDEVAIYNPDFVIEGIIRQELDYDANLVKT